MVKVTKAGNINRKRKYRDQHSYLISRKKKKKKKKSGRITLHLLSDKSSPLQSNPTQSHYCDYAQQWHQFHKDLSIKAN